VFVELIESLRCPRTHDESALIASATKTEARHIIDGVLGCPVCNAEFPIRDGVAHFGPPPTLAAFEVPSQETAMRLAAFLELTDAQGFALLCSRWAIHIEPLSRLTETPIVAVNPSIAMPVRLAAGAIRGSVVPFAEGSARAFALDNAASKAIIASGVRAVRAGGRVLGPATLPVPEGVSEIVRDETMWVGEKTAASQSTPRLVPLSRAKKS
jgi:uncharacterized protein YbaR (Trm112 family)